MATEIYKVIAQSNPAATTLTDVYTVPASTEAVISSIVLANRGNQKIAVRLAVAVAGAADSNEQYVAYDIALPANGVQEFTFGVTLSATDKIRAYTDVATLSVNVFGTEIV